MDTYRALVIGCGKIGATFEIDSGLFKPASHAAAIKANARMELVGLVDPDAAALARATEHYQVPGFADAKTAIEQTHPDVVVISTPPSTHEEYLSLATQAKARAVICEKPVSDSLESAERMIVATKAADTIVLINHQRRFFSRFVALREKIAAGGLGRIQQISTHYSNGLTNNGTHTIDAVQFLLDDHAVWAIGKENSLNTTAPFGTNIDGMLGFSRGAVMTLQSLDNAEFGAHDFVIIGTKGAVVIRQYGFSFEEVAVKEGVTFSGVKELNWGSAAQHVEPHSMLVGTYAHLVACLDGLESPRSTLEDGRMVMQTLEALIKSAKAGGMSVTI